MPSKLSKEIVAYIEKSISRGGTATAKRTVSGAIDYAVHYYLRTATGKFTPRKIETVKDLVFNMVNAHVRDQKGIKQVERNFGTLLVTDSDVSQGWLQEEQKVVTYETLHEVYTGEEVNYRKERGKYILEKAFTGAMSSVRPNNYGSGANVLLRLGDAVTGAKFTKDTDSDEAQFRTMANSAVPEGERIWIKDAFQYAYFDGSTFKEEIAGELQFSVDCSSYFYSATAGIPVSNGGISYTKFPGATKAMKVLFYGKYRICIIARFYYTDNNADYDDWYETAPFELIVINSETQSIAFTKLVTHSTWSNLVCPSGIYGGYPDVQINKENGKLLLLTGSSPTTTTIGVKYYNEADPVTDPQIYDHTTNATVYRVPFSIDEVVINAGGTDFDVVQNIYTHSGAITSVDGVSVTGGITSTMFTQQPESFDIAVNRHMVVYKQEDTVPTTPEEVLIAYRLVAYGRWEFYDVTGAVVIQSSASPHSTACGAVTTTAVTDKAVAVVSYASRWGLLVFIREWIPSRDRTAVTFQMPFFEHGGANYTGRPDSDTTYSTQKGSTVVNRGYLPAEASTLTDDRFIILNDVLDKKPVWLSRVLWIQTWDNAGTEESGTFQEQGSYFWKNDFEAYELPINGSPSTGGSNRYTGNFVNNSDPTLIESTHGYNNTAAHQMTDDSVLLFVCRAERVDYFDADTQAERAPTEMNYKNYVDYLRAETGGLYGIAFDIPNSVEQHDLVAIKYIPRLQDDEAIIELELG